MRLKLAATLVLICIPVTALSDNWPQWRGSSGNGVSTESNLPTRWSKDDVAWKAPLKGLGVSSPIIWGDRVFVTGHSSSMKRLFDQNLSPRLPRLLEDLYPESAHIRDLGMRGATDTEVWGIR